MRASLGLLMLASASQAADLKRLAEYTCYNGEEIHLNVKAARVQIDGVVSFQTRAYHVNGQPMVPGPVIRMRAGDKCAVRVSNSLTGKPCNQHSNDYHCPDTTNLHTHGLHVSPYEDNIDTSIQPGGSHTYVYNLPKDHLMGTHFYHAHHHGSTAAQVGGGMAGTLLVDPHNDYKLPEDLKELYDDESVPPLFLHHFQMGGDYPPGDMPWAPEDIHSFWDQEKLLKNFTDQNNTVPLEEVWDDFSESSKNFYTVNGQYNPTVTVTAGVATLLRLIHGGGNLQPSLIVDSDLCELKLIARDGVFHQTPYLSLTAIAFLQGTRSDVAILCSESAVGTTINVRSSRTEGRQADAKLGMDQDHWFQLRVAARSAGVSTRPFPTSEAPLPVHFRRALDPDFPVQYGGETNVTHMYLAKDHEPFVINDRLFAGWEHKEYAETFCLNKMYEIDLPTTVLAPVEDDSPFVTGMATHTYHQHINHFVIVDGKDKTGMVTRDGEFRDTAPTYNVKIRFLPARYTGDVVAHCHMLQHEDRGMMTLLKLEDCGVPIACAPLNIDKLTNDPSKYDISDCDSVAHGTTCTVRNIRTGQTSTFICPKGNTDMDFMPFGELPDAPNGLCKRTCYGSSCDYYANYYGYRCSTLENIYGCDCSSCVCKNDF